MSCDCETGSEVKPPSNRIFRLHRTTHLQKCDFLEANLLERKTWAGRARIEGISDNAHKKIGDVGVGGLKEQCRLTIFSSLFFRPLTLMIHLC